MLLYTFAVGPSSKFSRVTIELVPETEAIRVSVNRDQWAEDRENIQTTLKHESSPVISLEWARLIVAMLLR